MFPNFEPLNEREGHGQAIRRDVPLDRYERTSLVETYPPNGYCLYETAGNVWEWTDGYFAPSSGHSDGSCCAPQTPQTNDERFARKVIKGGSHLCAPNYCLRYRPAARHGETIATSTGHISFRCVIREEV